MIKVTSSILLLIMLNGCFGATIFSIGPIPVKPGDVISKPITSNMWSKTKSKSKVDKQPKM